MVFRGNELKHKDTKEQSFTKMILERLYSSFVYLRAFVPLCLIFAFGCGGDAPPVKSSAEATPVAIDITPEPPKVNQSTGGAAPVSGEGHKVSGVVHFNDEKPKRLVIKMDADPKCAQMHPGQKVGTEDAIVTGDGVANVLVYVKSGLPAKTYDAPTTPVEIDQEGCVYRPHIIAIMVGQELAIRNSDQTLHNIDCMAKINPPFNTGQPGPGVKQIVFHKPEIGLKVKCDVHPWMSAYIHVMEHPYFAVTGPNAAYAIGGLPPGDYTLEAWHERFGTQEIKVKIEGPDVEKADFTFEGPKKI